MSVLNPSSNKLRVSIVLWNVLTALVSFAWIGLEDFSVKISLTAINSFCIAARWAIMEDNTGGFDMWVFQNSIRLRFAEILFSICRLPCYLGLALIWVAHDQRSAGRLRKSACAYFRHGGHPSQAKNGSGGAKPQQVNLNRSPIDWAFLLRPCQPRYWHPGLLQMSAPIVHPWACRFVHWRNPR